MDSQAAQAPPIPITLLSGFLGAGKTTLLRQILENKGGYKVAVVVNDVAKVNIDSKLVRERTGQPDSDLADCMELQNGCACCNASDELLQSILQLLRLAQRRGYAYDRIIIELSGVAEPKNIRREFVEAALADHVVMKQAELQTMVTVVDSPAFSSLYSSREDMADRPDLCQEEGDDGDADSERKVVDLLVEQVECADYVMLNKSDLMEGDDARLSLKATVAAINPTASVLACEWGKVPIDTVMGPPRGTWVACADDEDDLREAVRVAKEQGKKRKGPDDASGEEHGDGHGHEHGHEHGDKHGHGHSHDSGSADDCKLCEAESERQATTTAATRFGITSFVYTARLPFHPKRLMQVIMQLPVKVDPQTGSLVDEWSMPHPVGGADAGAGAQGGAGATPPSPMRKIIRSKGFIWVANQHRSAQYWSHAGHYFELRSLGLWWCATAIGNWPDGGAGESEEVRKIASDFARKGDPSHEWGDRRQELVLIGIGMDRGAICGALDACLLTAEEMQTYKEQASQQGSDVVRVSWDGDGGHPRPEAVP